MQRGKKKKAKKKLAPGGKLGALNEYGTPIGQGLSLAGDVVNTNSKKPSVAGSALSGAGKGMAAGATFGPYGALIGAGVGAIAGGITGGIQRKKFEEAAYMDEMENNANVDRAAMMNAGNYKHGGKLLAKSLNTVKGGRLEAISDDAVEVKANNPSKTDSVELENAYVDDDEVIDNQSRVFSDSIKLRNGRTIAKEAKRLEKQKKENYDVRFADSNSRLDEKLDTLFNYQESMKKSKATNKLAKGGKIHIDPSKKGTFTKAAKAHGEGVQEFASQVLKNKDSYSSAMVKKANFAKNATKFKHQLGGELGQPPVKKNPRTILDAELQKNYPGKDLRILDRNNVPVVPGVPDTPAMAALRKGYDPTTIVPTEVVAPKLYSPVVAPISSLEKLNVTKTNGFQYKKGLPAKGSVTKPKFAKGGKSGEILGISPEELDALGIDPTNTNQFDWKNLATQVATYGPNIANAVLQRRLKGPAAPQLEDRATLDRVSPDANLAANNNDFLNTNRVIQRNTGQAGNLTAATGSLLARKFAANNQIYGQNQALNAQINNQEVGMNTAIRARNTERTNEFRADKVNFNNQKQTLTSQNITNAATKFLQQGREKNEMALDREKYQILMGQYNDLPEEMKAKYASLFANRGLKPSNKKGGKIKPNKKKAAY